MTTLCYDLLDLEEEHPYFAIEAIEEEQDTEPEPLELTAEEIAELQSERFLWLVKALDEIDQQLERQYQPH